MNQALLSFGSGPRAAAASAEPGADAAPPHPLPAVEPARVQALAFRLRGEAPAVVREALTVACPVHGRAAAFDIWGQGAPVCGECLPPPPAVNAEVPGDNSGRAPALQLNQ